MKQLTKDEAIKMGESDIWKTMTAQEITAFQLYQELSCIPFQVYHENIEKALGRLVYTYEFASSENLKKEFLGISRAPTLEEIISLIPSEKLLIVTVGEN